MEPATDLQRTPTTGAEELADTLAEEAVAEDGEYTALANVNLFVRRIA